MVKKIIFLFYCLHGDRLEGGGCVKWLKYLVGRVGVEPTAR